MPYLTSEDNIFYFGNLIGNSTGEIDVSDVLICMKCAVNFDGIYKNFDGTWHEDVDPMFKILVNITHKDEIVDAQKTGGEEAVLALVNVTYPNVLDALKILKLSVGFNSDYDLTNSAVLETLKYEYGATPESEPELEEKIIENGIIIQEMELEGGFFYIKDILNNVNYVPINWNTFLTYQNHNTYISCKLEVLNPQPSTIYQFGISVNILELNEVSPTLALPLIDINLNIIHNV